jgi:hypothetical protein
LSSWPNEEDNSEKANLSKDEGAKPRVLTFWDSRAAEEISDFFSSPFLFLSHDLWHLEIVELMHKRKGSVSSKQ